MDESSDKKMTGRAKSAAKRTNIDAMVGIRHLCDSVKVSCGAHDLCGDKVLASERVLLRVPDLLDLAVYAWYKLQEEP